MKRIHSMALGWIATVLTPMIIIRAADLPPNAPFQPAILPVRAFMICDLPPASLDSFLDFVRRDFPREGVNTLVFQIDYNYQFKSHPELAGASAYSEAQIKALVRACRQAGVKLIPLVNCLGHQSWAGMNGALLRAYPEFDETAGLYPGNKGIYCRSYCPRNPAVHRVVFDVLDEIAAVFEADAIHVGMDEVFLLGEDTCPRCRGADKAELFAQEVRSLHDHLKRKSVRMWMWGDRLLDGRTTGLGEWEASMNATARAIDLIPKDIVICDWHYESAPPTPAYFAVKGFDVISCSFNQPAVAEAQAEQIVALRRADRGDKIGPRLLGVMATNWSRSASFADDYAKAKSGGAVSGDPAVDNFIRLFARVRERGEEADASSAR